MTLVTDVFTLVWAGLGWFRLVYLVDIMILHG